MCRLATLTLWPLQWNHCTNVSRPFINNKNYPANSWKIYKKIYQVPFDLTKWHGKRQVTLVWLFDLNKTDGSEKYWWCFWKEFVVVRGSEKSLWEESVVVLKGSEKNQCWFWKGSEKNKRCWEGSDKYQWWFWKGSEKYQCWFWKGSEKNQCWFWKGSEKHHCWFRKGSEKNQCWFWKGSETNQCWFWKRFWDEFPQRKKIKVRLNCQYYM